MVLSQRLQTLGAEIYKQRMRYLFLLPALTVFTLFKFYPMYRAIVFSVSKYSFAGIKFVGLTHYQRLLTDPDFGRALLNTFELALLSIVMGFWTPILLALLLHEVAFKNAFRTVYYIPHLFSWVVIGGIWLWLLSPNGLINSALGLVGIKGVYWLTSAFWIKPVLVVMGIWHGVGYSALLYLASLQSIDPQIYEAAKIDGATKLQQAMRITLPLITPTVVVVFILNMIKNLQSFDQIYIMSGGGSGGLGGEVKRASDVVMTYAYDKGIGLGRLDYASAISLVLFVIILILTLANMKMTKYDEGRRF